VADGRPRRDLGTAAAVRAERDVAAWDDEADVIVVGFGGAGACAAIAAADAGADVLLLERMGGGGGTTALSTGQIYLGGGTAIQKACGFDDSAGEMCTYLLAACGPGVDEAKIRLYAAESVAHFDWLVAQGVPFKASFYGDGSYTPTDDCLSYSGSELAWPYCHLARPAPRGHTVPQEGIDSARPATVTTAAASAWAWAPAAPRSAWTSAASCSPSPCRRHSSRASSSTAPASAS
jgi:hypothetical protein